MPCGKNWTCFLIGTRPARVLNITVNGRNISGVELANTFNDYLVNNAYDVTSNEFIQFLPDPNSSSMFLKPVSEQDVYSVFSQLKNSSSRDIDGIKIRPIKYVLDILVPCITHIFNLCLSNAVFPERMQIAKVSVLFKKGDKNDVRNYRPISILSVFSKGLEKLMHRQLYQFFENHNVISPTQFGFREHQSTEMALLEQKKFILSEFEKKKHVVLGLYVDFSKAFDNIQHSTLFEKLHCYGIRGHALDLFKSYLKHRKQVVEINHNCSTLKPITKGVPQGSILGALLFIAFINDLIRIYPDAM